MTESKSEYTTEPSEFGRYTPEYSHVRQLEILLSLFIKQVENIGCTVESGVLYPSMEKFFVIRKA